MSDMFITYKAEELAESEDYTLTDLLGAFVIKASGDSKGDTPFKCAKSTKDIALSLVKSFLGEKVKHDLLWEFWHTPKY